MINVTFFKGIRDQKKPGIAKDENAAGAQRTNDRSAALLFVHHFTGNDRHHHLCI